MIPKIEWNSREERIGVFDALVVLANRGVITIDVYHSTMEIIMGHDVFTHELGTTGLIELRKELLGLERKDSIEILLDMRK